MSEPIIRPARPEDLPEMVELCGLHAAYENAEFNPAGKEQALAEALFSRLPVLQARVIEQRSSLLGYATATREYSTWQGGFSCTWIACSFAKTQEDRGWENV